MSKTSFGKYRMCRCPSLGCSALYHLIPKVNTFPLIENYFFSLLYLQNSCFSFHSDCPWNRSRQWHSNYAMIDFLYFVAHHVLIIHFDLLFHNLCCYNSLTIIWDAIKGSKGTKTDTYKMCVCFSFRSLSNLRHIW